MTLDSSKSTEANSAASPIGRGVSGKKLTIALLSVLGLVGLCLSYVLWSYNRINASRQLAEEAWYVLAEELGQRYRTAESSVARQDDAREMPPQLAERFRLAIDRFRSTAQPAIQSSASREVEGILEIAGSEMPFAESVRTAAAAYNDRIRELQSCLSTPGGRAVSAVLNIPQLREFP